MIDGAAAATGPSSRSRASSSTRRYSRTTPGRAPRRGPACAPGLACETFALVDQIRVDDELVYSLDWTRPRPRREDPRSLLLRSRALRGPLPLPVLGLLALPPRLGQVGGDDDEAGARRRTSRRSRVRDDGPRARCGRSSTRRWSWPRTRTSSTSAREPRRPRLRSRLRWGARAVGSRVRPPGRSLGSLGRSPAPVLRSSCSSPSSGCVCVGGKGRWLVRLGEAPRNPGRSPRNLPFLHL